jgi:hypothetical protein
MACPALFSSYGHRQEVYVGSSSFISVYAGGLFRTFQWRFGRPSPEGADYFKRGEPVIVRHDRRKVGHFGRGVVLPGVRHKGRALHSCISGPQ